MKNITELSKKLISVNSIKENPAGLKEVLEVAKKELPEFDTCFFEKDNTPSLLFSNIKNAKKFKIILNAHLDVVAGQSDQFTAYVKNNRLYGRGAMDMKAAAAAEILVFKKVANKVNYPLGLQLVTDEEVGGFKGTKLQIDNGVKADFIIAGEPTDLKINTKAKGIVWAKLRTIGTSAHAAYPWKGKSAVMKMVELINTLQKTYPQPDREVWKTTLNISKIITANETFNIVPEDCEIWLDIRYIPEEENVIINNLNKIIPNDFEFEILLKEPPQFMMTNNQYIKKLRKAAKNVTGVNPSIINKHGGSDIRHFNKVGCNGITFGPTGDGMHTEKEWVNVKSLIDYYQILEKFLLDL